MLRCARLSVGAGMLSLTWISRRKLFEIFSTLITEGVSREEGTSFVSLITTQLPLTLLSSGVY